VEIELTNRNGALDLRAARHGDSAVAGALLLIIIAATAHADVLLVVLDPEDGAPAVAVAAGRRVGGHLHPGDEEPLPQREGDADRRARRDEHVRRRRRAHSRRLVHSTNHAGRKSRMQQGRAREAMEERAHVVAWRRCRTRAVVVARQVEGFLSLCLCVGERARARGELPCFLGMT